MRGKNKSAGCQEKKMTFVIKFFILDIMEQKERKKNGTFDGSRDSVRGRSVSYGGDKRLGASGPCSFACADIRCIFQLCGKW